MHIQIWKKKKSQKNSDERFKLSIFIQNDSWC